MNKKIKVLTVIGTRPEIIRLACVFKVLNENTNHILVNTNQNFTYELNKIFFNDLELKMPKYEIKGKKNSVIKNIQNQTVWRVTAYDVEMLLLAQQMGSKIKEVKFAKINIDDNRELTDKYNVASIPCLVIFKNGKEVKRSLGAMSLVSLKNTYEQYL